MSRAQFTIAYDGPALNGGTMDVRDLAPALLAVGQLIDSANNALNRDDAKVSVNVKATQPGSFSISLEIIQTYSQQIVGLFAGTEVTAAANILALLAGGGMAGRGLLWLIKRLRGRKPDRIERVDPEYVRIAFDGETIIVPLKMLRLYQDLAVRTAAERMIYEPLQREGIDRFIAFKDSESEISVTAAEAEAFKRPEGDEQVLLDDVRRSAFSIVSLAFKDDNKWRLYDGNSQISTSIADEEFLRSVDRNEISFAKGDVLICDVRVRQSQTPHGLKTEYTVEKVVEHKHAPRQLTLHIEDAARPNES
jgi:hypothetical protein